MLYWSCAKLSRYSELRIISSIHRAERLILQFIIPFASFVSRAYRLAFYDQFESIEDIAVGLPSILELHINCLTNVCVGTVLANRFLCKNVMLSLFSI